METIGPETTADLFFQINWSSQEVMHTEAYAASSVNFWRDVMPHRLYHQLMGARTGDQVRLNLPAKVLLPRGSELKAMSIERRQFSPGAMSGDPFAPRAGRFYPKGLLKDLPGIYQSNIDPFRCIHISNGNLGIEMGHPLTAKLVEMQVTTGSVRPKLMERGGAVRHWGEIIAQGAGMQARWNGLPTDFFSDNPFHRKDAAPDDQFYARPRLVQHMDDAAIDMVKQLASRCIGKQMRVLDLMSSWQTQLPASIPLRQLVGLGLNEVELKENKALTSYVVQDLNQKPQIPFGFEVFDAVVCNASIEYLTHPREIFKEVARTLVPGGPFLVTFSNRWFEPKAVQLWAQLHEFERMGLVLEYFQLDGLFGGLHTYSVRGLERPSHDKYYGRIPFADPVYAVWGRRK